jgi:DNA-binding transcriptional ArsR family regulator
MMARPSRQTVPPRSASAPGRRFSAAQAETLAVIFKMLGNANRLRILAFLATGEKSVSEIETALGIHQPTLSQQLGELRDAQLIVGRRVAKSALYALTAERGRSALHTIDMVSGHAAPHIDVPLERLHRRPHSQPAAMFASVIPVRTPAVSE